MDRVEVRRAGSAAEKAADDEVPFGHSGQETRDAVARLHAVRDEQVRDLGRARRQLVEGDSVLSSEAPAHCKAIFPRAGVAIAALDAGVDAGGEVSGEGVGDQCQFARLAEAPKVGTFGQGSSSATARRCLEAA